MVFVLLIYCFDVYLNFSFVFSFQMLMEPMILSVLYIWCQINRDFIVNFWFGTQFKVRAISIFRIVKFSNLFSCKHLFIRGLGVHCHTYPLSTVFCFPETNQCAVNIGFTNVKGFFVRWGSSYKYFCFVLHYIVVFVNAASFMIPCFVFRRYIYLGCYLVSILFSGQGKFCKSYLFKNKSSHLCNF